MKPSFFLTFFLIFQSVHANAGESLERIKQAGVVRCGARTTANAFVASDGNGGFKGIDAEICKTIATAVLGRPDAIQIVPVNRGEGDRLLAENKIDVLLAGNYWNPVRAMQSDFAFPSIFYHSALAFIGHYNPDATSMRDYAGARVCVDSQQPFVVKILREYNTKHRLDLRIMAMPSLSRAKELLYLKRCDLILERLEILHSDYFKKAPADVDLVVLPEIVKSYATGPVIRGNDQELFKIVRWLILGLIKAEEKGINAQNIEDFLNTDDPEIKALLSENQTTANRLGVDTKWLYRTIAEQGNYGDIIARGLGEKSDLKLNRGLNKLRRDGGIVGSPDFAE